MTEARTFNAVALCVRHAKRGLALGIDILSEQGDVDPVAVRLAKCIVELSALAKECEERARTATATSL